MFSFLITLSIFTYLFRLFWVFVLRVSFSPGVRHSLLISVASPVAEQGSGCTAFGSCGAQALGAQPLAAATRGLGGCGPWAPERRLSSCSPRAQLLPVQTHASYIGRWILYHRAIREAQIPSICCKQKCVPLEGGVSVYFLICQMEIILFTLRHVRCEN